MKKPYDLTQIEKQLDTDEWKEWYSPVIKRAPTYSEAFLAYLFDSLGIIYEREFVIEIYPLDFAIPELNFVVDIDSPCYRRRGGVTSKKKKGDTKELYIRKLGWEFHRFKFPRFPFTYNRFSLEDRIDEMLAIIENLKKNNHNIE